MAQIKIGFFSLKDHVGCSNFAIHAANYLVGDRTNSVAIIEPDSVLDPIFKDANVEFNDDKTFELNNVHYYPQGCDEEPTEDILIYDFGKVNIFHNFERDIDKLFLCSEGDGLDIEDINEYLSESGTQCELILCTTSKESLQIYKNEGYSCILVGDKKEKVCPYDLHLKLDFILHKKNITPPEYHKDWEYEPLTFKMDEAKPEKKGFFGSLFGKKKKTETKTEEKSVEIEPANEIEDGEEATLAEETTHVKANEFENIEFVDVPTPVQISDKDKKAKEKEEAEQKREEEIEKQKAAEKKRKEEEKQKKEAKRIAEEKEKAEAKRIAEENKRKEKEAAEKKRKEEEKAKEEKQKQLEEERLRKEKEKKIAEEEKKKKAEADRIRKEEEAAKKAEEKRIAEEERKKKAEEDRIRKEKEAAQKAEEKRIADEERKAKAEEIRIQKEKEAAERAEKKRIAIEERKAKTEELKAKRDILREEFNQKMEQKKAARQEKMKNKPDTSNKKGFSFSLLKPEKTDFTGHLSIFVTSFRHGCGASYTAGSIAAALANRYKQEVYIDRSNHNSLLPDDYLIKDAETDEERFEAYKSGLIVYDKGLYQNIVNDQLNKADMIRADLCLMVVTYEDLANIAEFISKQQDNIYDWLFVFNHVLPEQIKEIQDMMDGYNLLILPFHNFSKISRSLQKDWDNVIDSLTNTF